jgi:seryl-tRNA(Sec) selenium transferase
MSSPFENRIENKLLLEIDQMDIVTLRNEVRNYIKNQVQMERIQNFNMFQQINDQLTISQQKALETNLEIQRLTSDLKVASQMNRDMEELLR